MALCSTAIPHQSRSAASYQNTYTQKIEFLSYTAQFGKSYGTTLEFTQRFQNWLQTENFLNTQKFEGMTMAHNKFSDWHHQEKDLLLNDELANAPTTKAISIDLNSTLLFLEPVNFASACADGFRSTSNGCQACIEGCKSCTFSTTCDECMSDNFILHRTQFICQCFTGAYNAETNDCDVCGSGQYYDNDDGTCKDCLENCESCSIGRRCIDCLTNFTLSASKRTCACRGAQSGSVCSFCESDQYISGGMCVDCSDNCARCGTPFGECKECIDDSFVMTEAGECECDSNDNIAVDGQCVALSYCGAGYYNDGQNNCTLCGEYCQSCNYETGFCNQCDDTSFQILTEVTSTYNYHVSVAFKLKEVGECRCPTRTYLSGGTCVSLSTECSSGYYNDGANNCPACTGNCTECLDFTGECIGCPNDSYYMSDDGNCFCKPGYIIDSFNVCQRLAMCQLGTYNDGTNECLDCADNCTRCMMFTGQCVECQDSFTLFNTGTLEAYCSCDHPYQYLPSLNNTCTDLITCDFNGVLQYNGGSNICYDCTPQNCTECANYTGLCILCESPMLLDTANNECDCDITTMWWDTETFECTTLVSCGSRKYNPGDNSCPFCPDNCTSCSNFTGACTVCYDTFLLDASACSCNTDQYISVENNCTQCPDNCTRCADDTSYCTECDSSTNTIVRDNVCKCTADTDFWSPDYCVTLTDCGSGNYNNGANTCYICPTECTTCTAYGTCTACTSNYSLQDGVCECLDTQYLSGSTCIDHNSCAYGYYNDGFNNCVMCHSNFTDCFSATEGTVCSNNHELNYPAAGNCACGQYKYEYSNGYCYSCQTAGCGVCQDTTGTCTECKAFYSLTSSNTCNCLSNTYLSGGSCYGCPSTCLTCSSATSCRTCMSSYTLHKPAAYQCGCQTYQYIDASTELCTACPAKCETCDDASTCTSCIDSYTLNTTGQCVCSSTTFENTAGECEGFYVCPTMQYNNEVDNSCVDCPSVDYCRYCGLNDAGIAVCNECEATFELDSSSGAYVSCGCNSTTFLTDASSCQLCADYAVTCADSSGDATSCLSTFTLTSGVCACASDQFLDASDQCQTCPDTCTTCSSLSSCQTCLTTYSVLSSGLCGCATNQYLNSGNSTCVEIYDPADGYFNDGENLMTACYESYCKECQSGASTDCSDCMDSFTLQSDFSCTCMNEVEFYDSGTDSCVTIVDCSTGQYNDGANNCYDCQTNCTVCEGAADNCSQCVTSFTLNNDGECTCAAGEYESSEGLCVEIETEYCARAADSTGQCTDCDLTFSLTSSFECACTDTQFFRVNFGRCFNCPSGCSGCLRASKCTGCTSNYIFEKNKRCVCADGYFNDGAQCELLVSCASGYYKTDPTGSNTCYACDFGCADCNDVTPTCVTCEAGFTLKGGVCSNWRRLETGEEQIVCGDGCEMCSQVDGKCLECQEGFVKSEHNLRECLECSYWPVGPVESAVMCLERRYSEQRVIPEFDQSSKDVDWRRWGIVRSAHDLSNGRCGKGDFAFSAVAAAETSYAIKTGYLYDLSKQHVLDCDMVSQGCQGGFQTSASLLLSLDGAVLETDYPYVGRKQTCNLQQTSEPVFHLDYPGSQQISKSKEAFKEALRQGPLTVSFKVSSRVFFQYSQGIMPILTCETGSLNHSMLAIGYGQEQGVEYAIVQNVWGQDWGEQGVFRVELPNKDDDDSACGLFDQSSITLV